ncbi:MAG TPA: hypothetical protein VK914_12370 [bacterium]|jgi:hypothetical protein|nr:hypothetical protein [bacterium]
MRRIVWILALCCAVFVATPPARADEHGGGDDRPRGDGGAGGGGNAGRMDGGGMPGASSGRMDGAGPQARAQARPSMGRMHRHGTRGNMPNGAQAGRSSSLFGSGSGSGSSARPNARLSQMGVSRMPRRVSGRQASDPARSSAPRPQTGFDGRALGGRAIPRGSWSGSAVRGQMGFLSQSRNGFTRARVSAQIGNESSPGHYYWHQGQGFNYCHYRDSYGTDWFGWYLGSAFFWTEFYAGGWWIYDDEQDRWCYWSHGNWWWQDPGDPQMVYLYDDGSYIPAD